MSFGNNSIDESFNLILFRSKSSINNLSFVSTNQDFDDTSDCFSYVDLKSSEISSDLNYLNTFIERPIINNNLPKFEILKRKNRGKQTNNSRRVKHISNSLDNILTKIQVHFFSFIIDIANDALFTEFHEKTTYNFKGINYKIKTKFNHLLYLL